MAAGRSRGDPPKPLRRDDEQEYQRADWKRRPLLREQLDYARLDTHYLLALRELQVQALGEAGRIAEATEEFERLSRSRAADPIPGSPSFWRVKGARDLAPAQAAVLQALFGYREQQAERIDQPPFKVMGEATLLELVRRAPRQEADLHGVTGMTPDAIRRHGQAVLRAIEQGLNAHPPSPPAVDREPDEVQDRYDRLHAWRRDKARLRGVESDVILPRTALLDLARRAPRTHAELTTSWTWALAAGTPTATKSSRWCRASVERARRRQPLARKPRRARERLVFSPS